MVEGVDNNEGNGGVRDLPLPKGVIDISTWLKQEKGSDSRPEEDRSASEDVDGVLADERQEITGDTRKKAGKALSNLVVVDFKRGKRKGAPAKKTSPKREKLVSDTFPTANYRTKADTPPLVAGGQIGRPYNVLLEEKKEFAKLNGQKAIFHFFLMINPGLKAIPAALDFDGAADKLLALRDTEAFVNGETGKLPLYMEIVKILVNDIWGSGYDHSMNDSRLRAITAIILDGSNDKKTTKGQLVYFHRQKLVLRNNLTRYAELS
ncbi:MAG: hypothetical protein WC843_02805 [Candidatus Gracilibacteria bacterium]|jgi:hypothetical protein